MTIEVDQSLANDIEVESSYFPRSSLPEEWSKALIDDYSLKGGESQRVSERANQAAQGALVAQQNTRQLSVTVQNLNLRVTDNANAILAFNGRLDSVEESVATLESNVSQLQTQLNGLSSNPYGSLVRNQAAQQTVSTPENLSFNSSITGRNVTLTGDQVTIVSAGVYRISSLLNLSAATALTAKLLHNTTEIFSFESTSVNQSIPAFDMPLAVDDVIRVTIENSGTGDLAVDVGASSLNVSRSGL